ncbi:MAG: hypothetical protein IPJ19_08390 [Planctomycetes bacterium]|nr:hypothetical protein [Planctomycetota bacterium]
MTSDARFNADSQLLESLAKGEIPEGDQRLEELLRRRPEWRALLENPRATHGRDADSAFGDSVSEADRRLVAECLAEARATNARAAPAPNARPRLVRRTWILALAAAVLAVAAPLAWKLGETRGAHDRDILLNGTSALQFAHGKAAQDFSSFEWQFVGALPATEQFKLEIWAANPDGSRGARLFSAFSKHETRVEIPALERENWPAGVVWRVSCVGSDGISGSASEDWRASR